MVRIARERVADLFALAEREAREHHLELADRYVVLARRIGMRYNVRLRREFRELYCRSCSAFWVEGRTVRTRLRSGYRVRTCLRCGRRRRTLSTHVPTPASFTPRSRELRRDEGALSIPLPGESELVDEETEEE
jgi:RNase P subunit RPR2